MFIIIKYIVLFFSGFLFIVFLYCEISNYYNKKSKKFYYEGNFDIDGEKDGKWMYIVQGEKITGYYKHGKNIGFWKYYTKEGKLKIKIFYL